MLHRRKLWAATALCMFILWQIYQSLYLGHSASARSLRDMLWPLSGSEAKPCGCASCIVELSSSAWFDERYDSAINPLLTLHTAKIAPDVLLWWLKLQGSQTSVQLQGIILQMFDILPSPTMDTQAISRCRTCAVVGNSGRLRDSHHGREIDSHHWVLRMNRAQTAGFEEDVGTRTTHRFMYPESAMDLQPGVHLVLVPFKALDLKWVTSAFSTGELRYTYTRVKQFIEADKSKVLILNPAFLKYIHDKWTQHHGKYPSTGFTALLFALHTCDQVAVFGYGADSSGNWHHYWEENRYPGAFRRTGVHDADFELTLIKKLAAEGKISFYN
ncbi:CMP-N-acetylneuraminate-beta-galactosamide-alpha-2,3-sialyltransferase 2-like [Chelydra serpentina]|uniref:CMP-N-acetylneuraminate-beta-galactosamide-alpha-2,3-sialyltransferase 2 n=1 Tax=Chelydra serpentina TaxID=8475 RepID=A0A8T1S556_CHESE|nr:CMP-N-acetylneuraminate-beta-galactosamide-alpha-2,3-sialyltransferase 2-like [Chelydra serpentina]